MLGKPYIVASGDNLWNIAKKELGGGSQWPRIWRYNNRREVKKVTGRGIANPDLIYVGQVLLIPVISGMPKTPAGEITPPRHLAPAQKPTGPQHPAVARPAPSRTAPSPQPQRLPGNAQNSGPLTQQAGQFYPSVSIEYDLSGPKFPPMITPTAIIEIKMFGILVIKSHPSRVGGYTLMNWKEHEIQMTREMNHAFGTLVSDNRFIFNDQTKAITVRSMLVSKSNTPNTPATAIGIQMDSQTLIPKLRAEIRFPKLEGTIGNFAYGTANLLFIIEITPIPPRPPLSSPQPVRVPVPVPVEEPATNWGKVIGVGLVVAAGAIVVGTLVEDFFTAGAGVADDPASFAASAALFARGMTMVRGAATALPRVMAPANVQFGMRVMVAH
jgi:LysM repeat protein